MIKIILISMTILSLTAFNIILLKYKLGIKANAAITLIIIISIIIILHKSQILSNIL